MKVLVIGKTGQLARELARAQWPHEWLPTFAGRDEIDLSEPAEAGVGVGDRRPGLVINAAAYTAVDKAESEPDLAMRINGDAPGALAAACAALRIPFVTMSTDYVFDGSKDAAYAEKDETHPL